MVISDLESFINITEPCRLCRRESIAVSGKLTYCVVCYKEFLTNTILNLSKQEQPR